MLSAVRSVFTAAELLCSVPNVPGGDVVQNGDPFLLEE